MEVMLYSIRDRLSGYGYPMAFANDEVAKRSFHQIVAQPERESYKQDFELYRIGMYHTENGIIDKEDAPVLLCEGDQ